MWKMWKRITCGILIAAMIFTELPMSAMAASNTANTETGIRVYGDADGNGKLNAKDIAITLQYIVEDNPSGFHFTNADVTEDGIVDLKDLLAMRKRMAEPKYADRSSTTREVPTSGRATGENAAGENNGDQGQQSSDSESNGGGESDGDQGQQTPQPSQPSGSENPGGTTTTTYYQVTFALGSGQDSIDLPDTKTYVAGTRIDTLPTPVRQDVMFLGWYYDADMTVERRIAARRNVRLNPIC